MSSQFRSVDSSEGLRLSPTNRFGFNSAAQNKPGDMNLTELRRRWLQRVEGFKVASAQPSVASRSLPQ